MTPASRTRREGQAGLPKKGGNVLASTAKPLITALIATGLLVGCSGEETRRPPDAPEETSVVGLARSGERTTAATVPMPPTTQEQDCPPEAQRHRIGAFTPPEEGTVPPYEVINEERVEQDCAEALRLLVDTRVQDKAGYTLIARDLKARHKDLDAVSVEFTDTEGTFSYSGAALIFNTSAGAQFIGYTYGAPNDEGYYVSVADD